MARRDKDSHPGTYQTRISGSDAALSDYAALYGRLQRRLFADVQAGHSAVSLKSLYIRTCGIPGRMFNSMRVALEGKTAAATSAMSLRRDLLEGRVRSAEKDVRRLKRGGNAFKLHNKRRHLDSLRRRLANVEADMAAGVVRLCFGSKKLWRKRHQLAVNGYESHDEWLSDWRDARSGEFFVLGSRDETAGCQLCVATVADDGSLTLRLRMPDALADEYGKYVYIEGVRFAYGHDVVLAALQSSADYRAYRRLHGAAAVKGTDVGQSMSYRFKRDSKGWRVFVTTAMVKAAVVTDRRLGAVGVDLNADRLAVCETDASGNPVNAFNVALVTYGKSSEQAEALIGEAVKRVVDYALDVRKPLVIERLDFGGKKAALGGESAKRARMLSSFAYGKVKAYFQSRCYRVGVGLMEVSPAYSSVIGRVKFMERYGLSGHQAAALVLARRYLGFSERVPREATVSLDGGGHVTLGVPVRKRQRHVWSSWSAMARRLRPALAAQYRLRKRNPVRAPARAGSY